MSFLDFFSGLNDAMPIDFLEKRPIGEKSSSLKEGQQVCANLVQRRLSGELKSSGSFSEDEKLADSPELMGRVSPDLNQNNLDDENPVDAFLDEIACRGIFFDEGQQEEVALGSDDEDFMGLFAAKCQQACEDQKLINSIPRFLSQQF